MEKTLGFVHCPPSTEDDLLLTLYNLVKDSPDLPRLPLPKAMYERFNIPPPQIPTLKEALKLHYENQLAYLNQEVEVRPPAPGGVRPIPEAPPLELKILPGKTLKDIDLSGNLIDETPQGEESK